VKIVNGGVDIYGRELQDNVAVGSSFTTSKISSFVTLFWPKKVKASKLEEIHAKMVMKESAPRAASDAGPSKKPRPSTSGKTNGSLSTPSSAIKANGKSHR
jgi:hypothetical protein